MSPVTTALAICSQSLAIMSNASSAQAAQRDHDATAHENDIGICDPSARFACPIVTATGAARLGTAPSTVADQTQSDAVIPALANKIPRRGVRANEATVNTLDPSDIEDRHAPLFQVTGPQPHAQ